jgi:SAM-dependent methyltransferase
MTQDLDPKHIVATGYDTIGEWYAKQAVEDISEDGDRHRYTALLMDRLPAGAEILDLGCGAGVPTTRILAERFAVTGVDISTSQIERAQRNVPNAQFHRGDMTELNLEPASLDAVVDFFSIIHVPQNEHPKLFQKIAYWLRPGGLFVAGLGAASLESGVEEDWHGAPIYWSHFGSDTNRRLIEDAGLEILSSEEVTGEEDGEHVTFCWVVARKARPGDA